MLPWVDKSSVIPQVLRKRSKIRNRSTGTPYPIKEITPLSPVYLFKCNKTKIGTKRNRNWKAKTRVFSRNEVQYIKEECNIILFNKTVRKGNGGETILLL